MLEKENLEKIEALYNFKYPDIYYRLLNDGMLNWGLFGPDWSKTEFPKLKNNPPLLLFGQDFEIIDSENDIIEEINDFSNENDYRQTKKEFHNRFIPFGKTGAGDLYCFLLDETNKIDSVVLVWHDANEVNILSKNIESFIFRQLLECVIEPYEAGLIMSGDFKENINNQLDSHKKYISTKEIEILREIYNRDMNNGLIKYKELKEILSSININDETFEYQEEEYREVKKSIITIDGERHHIDYRLSIISLPNNKLQFIKEIRKICSSSISISDLIKLKETPFVVYENQLSLYKELKLKNFTSSDKEVLLHLSEFYSKNIKLEYKYQTSEKDYTELK